jgi:predicted GTPase
LPQTIARNQDGTFEVKGFAELDDVCEALELTLDDEAMDEYSTIGTRKREIVCDRVERSSYIRQLRYIRTARSAHTIMCIDRSDAL